MMVLGRERLDPHGEWHASTGDRWWCSPVMRLGDAGGHRHL